MSSQNPIIKPLAVTAVFNTGIALVLHFMVIRFADTDRKIRVSRAYEHLFRAM